MKLKIDVTQNDIEAGGMFNSEDCPVSRAIKRALAKIGRPEKAVCTASFGSYIDKQPIMLPLSAKMFILKYDAGHITLPFYNRNTRLNATESTDNLMPILRVC